jgi:hypothetical protein
VRYDGHCEEYFQRYITFLRQFEGEDEEAIPDEEMEEEIDFDAFELAM